ncbi:hypothetical protein [Arthrobacter sp. AQ5-05]|uniref:hypothetical protein n=1 Tax=Arthrobacter sp. AQ5-05 TaxID=2184581 RepID=UPI00257037BF|nr:hypothetical protein [Arthrobacter sp. AQ5-05]
MDQDRAAILAGYRRAEQQLRARLELAAPAELERPGTGTRWTNEELLFHMVFGYMVVRALLPLVRVVGRLPRPWGRAFAAALDSATVPFDLVDYWGSRAAALFTTGAAWAGRCMGHSRPWGGGSNAKPLPPWPFPCRFRSAGPRSSPAA